MKKSGPSSSSEAVTYPMKFCPNCENLLCPKEDKERKMLFIACRTCPYQEKAEGNVVMRHEINPKPQPLILQNAYEDPTLPCANGVSCPVCGHPKVVWFVANWEKSMVHSYACCNPKCGHNWRKYDQNSG